MIQFLIDYVRDRRYWLLWWVIVYILTQSMGVVGTGMALVWIWQFIRRLR